MAKNPEQDIPELDHESEGDFEEEEDEENGGWDDWNAEDGEDESSSDLLCLFCDTKFTSCDSLFDHCSSGHHFNFSKIKNVLGLDFYGSFKLINYVRSQVAANKCWSCGHICASTEDLRAHLHETKDFADIKTLIDNDKYLKPFLKEDPLLYSFDEDEAGEGDYPVLVDGDDLVTDFKNHVGINGHSQDPIEKLASVSEPSSNVNGLKEIVSASTSSVDAGGSYNNAIANGMDERLQLGSSDESYEDNKQLKNCLKNVAANNIRKVNEGYFGAYSSYGIHREMLSDKVRMDAYSQALLRNPSLLNGAVVMDVGCGTGILSLFAAQAGASKVIAVEASQKMASVASQIAKVNGLLFSNQSNGAVEVVNGMVEELDKTIQLQPHSVDVLVSEWMGYCLLYETMLSSVLYARDRWLKPGGAILPDTATIYAAGFGKGGTSLPFWENVFGYDMSCIGKEIVEDAARGPIVDVMSDKDLVTNAAILQIFDLVTMKPDEVDFTATVELEPSSASEATSCHGVVLWFDTGFTTRFCKETPAVLSTSPYTPPTHWSQTILTFRNPISLSPNRANSDISSSRLEAEDGPAERIRLRISIARSTQHRSIDISMEATCICGGGKKRTYPVQIFNLA